MLDKRTNNQAAAEKLLKLRATSPLASRLSYILAAVCQALSFAPKGDAEIPAVGCAKMNQNGSLSTTSVLGPLCKDAGETLKLPPTLTKLPESGRTAYKLLSQNIAHGRLQR